MNRPLSLILVTVDCLRADHVGFLGYHRPTTPFLDALAAESISFSNAIVAGAPTYYSFPAIMASRYPLALGRDVIGMAPGEPTIATALNQSGYATAAFLAGNPYLSRHFGYDAGFEIFRDFLSPAVGRLADSNGRPPGPSWRGRVNRALAAACHALGPIGRIYDELYFQYCQRLATPAAQSLDALRPFPTADVLVDQACEWLSGLGGRRFFLWLHFMDPHAPYYPTETAMQWMGQSIGSPSYARYLNCYWNRSDIGARRLKRYRDEIIALYDAGVRWVDAQVSRLVETVTRLHLWDDCVFALTADHGEEFLDHGGRYHSPSRVTEEVVRVPLLLRMPGEKARRARSPFSLVHLAPTLLDAVSASPPVSFRGTSHWPQLRRGEVWEEPAITECVSGCTNPFRSDNRLGARMLALRETRYKLVLDFGSATEQLFDLETDPSERHPLPADTGRPVRRRLLKRARQHLADSLKSRDVSQRLSARVRGLRLEWAEATR